MAAPDTLRGTKLLIKLGNGATPEVFAAPCALTTKGFNRSSSTNEFNVPDCADPDAPVWTERVKGAISAGVTGSGLLAKESVPAYESFFEQVDARQIQIVLDYDVAPISYQGAFHMTTLNITGEQDGLISVEVEFASSGEVSQL